MVLTHIALNIFVYASHRYGYKNYDLKDNSCNNWFISLLFGGEGWENNHHYDERNYSFKKHWYELDPVGIFISYIRLRNV
jgi:stearoyl-CoA desaturase (delta-9 desaturase)